MGNRSSISDTPADCVAHERCRPHAGHAGGAPDLSAPAVPGAAQPGRGPGAGAARRRPRLLGRAGGARHAGHAARRQRRGRGLRAGHRPALAGPGTGPGGAGLGARPDGRGRGRQPRPAPGAGRAGALPAHAQCHAALSSARHAAGRGAGTGRARAAGRGAGLHRRHGVRGAAAADRGRARPHARRAGRRPAAARDALAAAHRTAAARPVALRRSAAGGARGPRAAGAAVHERRACGLRAGLPGLRAAAGRAGRCRAAPARARAAARPRRQLPDAGADGRLLQPVAAHADPPPQGRRQRLPATARRRAPGASRLVPGAHPPERGGDRRAAGLRGHVQLQPHLPALVRPHAQPGARRHRPRRWPWLWPLRARSCAPSWRPAWARRNAWPPCAPASAGSPLPARAALRWCRPPASAGWAPTCGSR